MRESPELREEPKEPQRDVNIITDKVITRGSILQRDDDTVRIGITYPESGKGQELEIRRNSLNVGQPFEYRISAGQTQTDWLQSTPLQSFAVWERGAYITVDQLIEATERRRRSENLPSNTFTLPLGTPGTTEAARTAGEAYRRQGLEPYYFHKESETFAAENPLEAKTANALFKGDTGWKVHLNVVPENVRHVSEYLKSNYYNHKYLQGGEPDDGKVFTVYFGSKGMMDKSSQKMSNDLEQQLSLPGAYDETEVARGAVARFTVADDEPRGGNEFARYGAYGLSFLRDARPPYAASREEKIADAKRTY